MTWLYLHLPFDTLSLAAMAGNVPHVTTQFVASLITSLPKLIVIKERPIDI